MIIELAKNTGLFTYNRKVREDVRLSESLEKLLSFIVTFGTAFGYVFSGMYGRLAYIGYFKTFMLIVQLTFSGMMVLYLDKILENGYGIGSGVSLFIACNMCENLFWHCFSPVTMKTDNGIEFEGAVIALIHFLLTKKNKWDALMQAFYRQNVGNLNSVLTTFIVFLIVIYFLHFQANIKLTQKGRKGYITPFAIKLFYLSNTPIMIQTMFISNFHMMSSILYAKFRNYSWVRLLAIWQKDPITGRDRLIGGFTYYLKPPDGITGVVNNPSHFVIYFLIIVLSSGLFARLWLEVSGRSAVDMLKQITDSRMELGGLEGKKRSMIKVLTKNINTAAVLGGILIGIFSICSDLLGVIGSGTGIMLTVNIIYGYYEKIKDDLKEFDLREIIEK
jgi:protein transport protein SEC61 subunit alpha